MSHNATSHRTLGANGPTVSPIGLGCMGMSEFYDPRQMHDAESIRVIHRFLDAGGNFLDTADMYGVGRNEVLVGKAIAGRRADVVLATKFGSVRGPQGEFLGVRGDRQYVKDCCDASLRRLGVDSIDVYYQHRVDSKTPIEETVGAMAELVKAGKVRYLGLSEASPATIRRAAQATRSRHFRRNTRSGPAIRRMRSCPRFASWGSRSSPIARWDEAFSRVRSRRSTICLPTISAGTGRGFRVRIFRKTSSSSRR
jgi:aryl-alcohol dehydrogenase-like predicted oxidoreductase